MADEAQRHSPNKPVILTTAEVEAAMRSLPGWTCDGGSLRRIYTFPGFPEAVAFVSSLVGPAEAQGHHPDISVSYNRVIVSITTHDAGGLTVRDFTLARSI